MHIPVLFDEVMETLAIKPGGVYIDGTLGSAGHSSEILRRAGSEGTLLGIDRDSQALERSRQRLQGIPGRVILAHGQHGDIAALAAANGIASADGVLLDLGVSSDQLDTPERGFSFRFDGPLDMRMNPEEGKSAAELVAEIGCDELTELLRKWGEEPAARRIANAIVAARRKEPIVTTGRLAEVVAEAVGRRNAARNPATRTFQALRMAVNDEMGNLIAGLEAGLELLKPGGRMAVITFESLTDRVVKRFFAEHEGRSVSLQQGGSRWEGTLPAVRRVNRHPIAPSEAECAANPRARSAKLRVAERI